ncbi:carbohydrate-binding module family 18 protein [Stipitochalara longipes BDJ]|nr:carbohydrate-binding module family 18 protein [Stipitochalara longipes BDJ]
MAPTQTPVSKPIAVAHLLMDWGPPDHSWADIKIQWSKIRFDAVNVLNISPFIVQPDHKTFGLASSDSGLADLLNWIITTARTQNPNIKILAQQFYGTTAWSSLDITQINTHAASVASVVKQYGLDGYDVDYEENNGIPQAPIILNAIRRELDALSKTEQRPLYVTLSPASTHNLTSHNLAAKAHPISKSVDWVNIQTYDGGRKDSNNVQSWLNLGFNSSQLTYGIWPEITTDPGRYSPPISEVKSAYTSQKLGGINLWRLTSGNFIFENQVQVLVYNFLHNTTLSPSPDPTDVEAHWKAGYDAQMQVAKVA